ncbi:FAD-binding and (Fe-S)-binding domain-containing protein [Colwellia sp. 4_MG-2023]|uniref:FAD-binding and (Fe-S)-binding domain-containing protein n=1 Tax=unclassified Colwellia TaxID=196834 RepID=UPI0026E3C1F2|nr:MULTISPECIES: FAD-binding and (Fe-S)-binding domain-containing protein [unclassified Colwellia]MDO6506514.1 FAD-binding and (Fe-S)-binding domain-containing protein [Colwellia sp. 5_MG-2023]MDO6555001.1 FAD-binding and (Fe-S)-binding domain-containing protein [Colwellia sp. 4_MG-2023]
MLLPPYQHFAKMLACFLPEERIISSYAKRLAFGVDASFYRLVPKLVLILDTEAEVIKVLNHAAIAKLPVTFRAAGTSLSGQAQSDSILILLTTSWRNHQIVDLGLKIKLGPGVIGADANKYLLPYGRKIGPDPASINTCKVAGIAANNASGMCCGVAQNSYHTLDSIRVVLHDGAVLDTGDKDSVSEFRKTHSILLSGIKSLALETNKNENLRQLINHKYRLKNTTGYAINSLVDFEDPIDILAHLMIGSEGTLGFISSITYNTVVEHKYRASTLVFFPTMQITCHAVSALASANVSAVELMDRRALASVSDMDGLPDFINTLDEHVGALLIETCAANAEILRQQVAELELMLADFEQTNAIKFTDVASEYSQLWAIRKGTFPAVGAVRETGTTVIIEDVAFPVARLADGVADLQLLFTKYQYDEAIIFGHALEGNLHFVFTQDFSTEKEIKRYQSFMDDVCQLVAVDYQGSLKAEHGTGRNMAPFVELEWGSEGLALMQQIKQLFDPQSLLNPGVIINDNAHAHITNLKALPAADIIVDKCIECGFCEPVCPSNGLSFTPRQRITSYREISRLTSTNENPELLAELKKDFNYLGIDTCAATGLCAERCPVGINTGDLIRELRHRNNEGHQGVANAFANNFSTVEKTTRMTLAVASFGQRLLGNKVMAGVTGTIRKLSANKLPLWNKYIPQKAHYNPTKIKANSNVNEAGYRPKVVYIPSCSSRNMGQSLTATDQRSLTDVTLSLIEKAGFDVISPDFTGECCGMPFNSKGMFLQAEQKSNAMLDKLAILSEQGKYPILIDTSPCKSMLLENKDKIRGLSLFEPFGFVEEVLINHLNFTPVDEPIMLHITCSSSKMGLAGKMQQLAERCSTQVIIPEHIQCCGFAGDKGFTTPELNDNALAPLKAQVPQGCTAGYSNSRTCEIGLSQHAGIDYQSIIYLVDKVTTKKVGEVVRH